MKHPVLENIEKLFEKPENLTKENMERALHETFILFSQLREQLGSKEPSVRLDAQEQILSLKSQLEAKIRALSLLPGSQTMPLETLLATPENFSKQEWQTLQNAKKQIETYNQMIVEKTSSLSKVKKKSKKSPKNWVAG